MTGNGVLAAYTLDGKLVWQRNLAEEYGVSAERIRQIEKKALGLMKTNIAA